MNDFLTTRQVLDILKVDRITIYRMLNDGRLRGTKIGQQWRFSRMDVEKLLNGERLAVTSNKSADETGLPIHCLQTIQNLFASVSQYSAILIGPGGELITEMSNPCKFCQVLKANPIARESCRDSQSSFPEQAKRGNKRYVCHAGLNYVGTQIIADEDSIGLFITGGYAIQSDNRLVKNQLLPDLSARYNIPENQLTAAFEQVPVLDSEQQIQLELWTASAATAFESILQERSEFAKRLKKIADLTQIS
jgi:excisionase family DNA binding protein